MGDIGDAAGSGQGDQLQAIGSARQQDGVEGKAEVDVVLADQQPGRGDVAIEGREQATRGRC
jgi:hypothetical protein